MPAPPRPPAAAAPPPRPPEDAIRLGGGFVGFARWFLIGKHRLMASYLGELTSPPHARDPAQLRLRFERVLRHGERVTIARALVTVLLAAGVAGAAATTILRVTLPQAAGPTLALLDRVAAASASASVLLLVLRFGFDRYLERVDVTAHFVAMQLATAPAPEGR